MNTPPPWLGISTGDWLINSNTPQYRSTIPARPRALVRAKTQYEQHDFSHATPRFADT